MDKALAAKAYLRQQARKAADYFKPTENVRVRDFVREVPGAVGQMFSGTRDTFVKGGKILGEGAAYAMDRNVRDQYKAGNTDILPNISNTTPRQMLASTAKAGLELAPINKIRGLATAAMSARAIPRMAAGGAMGYGYGVADEMSKPGPMNKDTFVGANPVISLLGGALFGAAASKKGMNWLKESGTNMADDVRNMNPANRTRHKVVGVHDMEPSGIYAAGGHPQMQEIPQSYRQEVRTTVDPFEPKSYLARVLMGKQSPVGNTVEDVTRKHKTTVNLQDENDVDYLRRIFSDDIVNEIKSGKTTNWRGENYADIAKVNLISEVPQTVEQKLAGKIKDAKLNSDTFYHGTSSGSADSIMASGFKPGSKLPANAYRGGGYGKTQSTVSFAETPKEAGIFSTLTKDGKIVEANLKPNARVVSIDGIEDAVDLEDYIGYLKKQKIDAVYIGGGEKELVVINPKAVTPTKSQLTDLHNLAKKPDPLLQEAGKMGEFSFDISGKPNKFKTQDREMFGVQAIEKNREIVQAKLFEVLDAEKSGNQLLRESRMREAISLAEKSNQQLSSFEKAFGSYRQPYNTEGMKRSIVGGLREDQLKYSENLAPLGSDGNIKVYRAIRSDTTGTNGGKTIYPGDFVSASKDYARTFGDVVIEETLPKSSLRTLSGTDEMIYNPKSQLTSLYHQTTGKKPKK